jgi:hypothetical protein
MSKKTISPKGNYQVPDCAVIQTLTGKFFCSSIENLKSTDYNSSLGEL